MQVVHVPLCAGVSVYGQAWESAGVCLFMCVHTRFCKSVYVQVYIGLCACVRVRACMCRRV